jgi:hypothetical protein
MSCETGNIPNRWLLLHMAPHALLLVITAAFCKSASKDLSALLMVAGA